MAVIDGISTGIGFTLALFSIALVREILGTGKIFAASNGTGGVQVLGSWYSPATVFLLPAGAFLTLGFILALVQKIAEKMEEKNHKKEVERFIDEAFAAPAPAEGESTAAAAEEEGGAD